MSTKELTLAALFAALAAVAAIIGRIGVGIVPFSLVPFVVMLTGLILKPRAAALSMTLYLFLGLIGLPIFSSPPYGGIAYITKPTFGFLLGYIFSAYTISKLNQSKNSIFAILIGLMVLYLIGLSYLWFNLNFIMGTTITYVDTIKVGFLPYILPDLGKALAAILIATKVNKRLKSISQ